MTLFYSSLCGVLLAFPLAGSGLASDPPTSNTPAPVAATRPELKEQLERSKQSHPRLPLPPPTEAELAAAKARAGRAPMTGIINNGRMRKLYLPAELLGGGLSREPDTAMTLNNTFKTMFFWIVSRANNCAYCQGHQEVKLAGDGVKEDTIAALDGDWSEFNEAERAAFAFTRKLTFEPNQIADADIERLRKHYTDLQILEIITAVGGFNSMNRWTGSLAIPQEGHRLYLTPTPEKYQAMRSLVAPLPAQSPPTGMVCARPADRGPLETRAQVEAALGACRAYYSQTKGRLSPKLKAQIAYVAARNDRAWYALGHAQERLTELGMGDDAIKALDHPSDSTPPPDRAALALARKLTVDPALITDADIEGLRKLYSDHEVAEIVYQVTQAAFFDRLTEAAGLRLER
jgi:alkylhydroperoxidase family enzyme